MKSNLRNEIKSYIVRQGMTMQEIVDLLRDEHGWSDSVSNLSNTTITTGYSTTTRKNRGLSGRRCFSLLWHRLNGKTGSSSGTP